nr:MAG TPA: hypothetical protein [Caudoviricetes sp.]
MDMCGTISYYPIKGYRVDRDRVLGDRLERFITIGVIKRCAFKTHEIVKSFILGEYKHVFMVE